MSAEDDLNEAERRIASARAAVHRATSEHTHSEHQLGLAQEYARPRGPDELEPSPDQMANRRRQLREAQAQAARAAAVLERCENELGEAEAAARAPRAALLAQVVEKVAENEWRIGAVLEEADQILARLGELRGELCGLVGQAGNLDQRKRGLDGTYSPYVGESGRMQVLRMRASGIMTLQIAAPRATEKRA